MVRQTCVRLDGYVLEGDRGLHVREEHADDGIVGVHGCGEVASGRRLGGSHHRRPLHLLILMLLLLLLLMMMMLMMMLMLRRARCVWRMHVGGR